MRCFSTRKFQPQARTMALKWSFPNRFHLVKSLLGIHLRDRALFGEPTTLAAPYAFARWKRTCQKMVFLSKGFFQDIPISRVSKPRLLLASHVLRFSFLFFPFYPFFPSLTCASLTSSCYCWIRYYQVSHLFRCACVCLGLRSALL